MRKYIKRDSRKLKSVGFGLLSLLIFSACSDDQKFDATGIFEANDVIVSAEAGGVIQKFSVEEGYLIDKNKGVGSIDTTALHLQKEQIQAQITTILSQQPNVAIQLAALYAQLSKAKTESKRVQNLYHADAATRQQLDDGQARVKLLQKKIEGMKATLNTKTLHLSNKAHSLRIKIKQIDEKMRNHLIINPIDGRVLTTYVNQYEMTRLGSPLYKIADLSAMQLKAYITGNQFAELKLAQQVTVFVDDGNGGYRSYQGKVIWISDEAEFTPKTIMTKEERANLVYPIKVKVKNDGYLKIGMYGKIQF